MLKLKVVLLIIVFTLLTEVSIAQLSVGIQGGWNSAIFNIKYKAEDVTLSYRTGFVIGAVVNYKLNNILSFQLEPRYIQKGEKTEFADLAWKNDILNEYLELPLLFEVQYPDYSIKPFVLAGINYGVLLNNKVISVLDGNESTFNTKTDYNKTDFALDLGGGVKYELLPGINLVLSGRYSIGISDITKLGGSVNTRGVQALAGVLYSL